MSKIIYHNHHIIPRHAGGTDDPSNLIRLTIPEHAEAHRVLWEQHGRLGDKLAWQLLAGLSTEAEETRRMMLSSPEVRAKMRASRAARIITQEHKDNIAKSMTGKKLTSEHIANIKRAHKEKWSNTPEEIRQAILEKLQLRQNELGSWKKGIAACANACRGKKIDPDVIARRNATLRAFYQTEEGKQNIKKQIENRKIARDRKKQMITPNV